MKKHLPSRLSQIYDLIPESGQVRLVELARDFGLKLGSDIGTDIERLIERGLVEKVARGLYRRKAA